MFIGQAMPRFKRDPHDWPTLNKWLYSIEFTNKQIRKYFLYSALVNYFPGSTNGSHIVPSAHEIAQEKPRLQKLIRDFNPLVVVPIGKLSLSYCLGIKFKNLSEVIGKSFVADPYNMLNKNIKIVPLPHPSGASTWKHIPKNKILLQKALLILKASLK